jgi:predicted transcriptional regulator
MKSIRRKLFNLGMTNREFCNLLGLCEVQFSNYLSGKVKPRKARLEKINQKLKELANDR